MPDFALFDRRLGVVVTESGRQKHPIVPDEKHLVKDFVFKH